MIAREFQALGLGDVIEGKSRTGELAVVTEQRGDTVVAVRTFAIPAKDAWLWRLKMKASHETVAAGEDAPRGGGAWAMEFEREKKEATNKSE